MIQNAELLRSSTISEISVIGIPSGIQAEIRERCDVEENSESINRFFFDEGTVDVKVCIFRHGKSTPWMPLGNFCVATSVEHYVQTLE